MANKACNRPRTKTLEGVFKWLEENGMSVYGPAVDFKNGRYCFGNQDFTVDEAIQLSRVKDNLGKPIYPGEEDDES